MPYNKESIETYGKERKSNSFNKAMWEIENDPDFKLKRSKRDEKKANTSFKGKIEEEEEKEDDAADEEETEENLNEDEAENSEEEEEEDVELVESKPKKKSKDKDKKKHGKSKKSANSSRKVNRKPRKLQFCVFLSFFYLEYGINPVK